MLEEKKVYQKWRMPLMDSSSKMKCRKKKKKNKNSQDLWGNPKMCNIAQLESQKKQQQWAGKKKKTKTWSNYGQEDSKFNQR